MIKNQEKWAFFNEFSYAIKRRISPLSVVMAGVKATKTSKLGNIIWIILFFVALFLTVNSKENIVEV